jgi:endo-1,4-beta-mannosidase
MPCAKTRAMQSAQPPARDPFLLGINYWPRTSAMSMWSHFDLGEIDEDFSRLAAMGLRTVRFFLMWEAFAPDPQTVDPVALQRFDLVLARAAKHGLQTIPTLFTGHMSGVNWLPEWTLDPQRPAGRFRTFSGGRESPYGIGDFYRGALLDAQSRLARALGERALRHPAVYAWDLGNEFSNLREPDSAEIAHAWSATLTTALEETSELPVTGGIHGEDLTLDRRLRPSSICAPWTFATMHGYPVYSAFARSADDPEVVPFLAALTRTFARKPLLFSEFGNPTCAPSSSGEGSMKCLDEEAMAQYATAVLTRLHARGATGALWWCWADYVPQLAQSPPFDRAPHELHFGIVRADGSEKPVASALTNFAQQQPTVENAADGLPIDESGYYHGLPASSERAYETYLREHDTARHERAKTQ